MIQLAAPKRVCPSTKVTDSRAMAAAAISQRSRWVRLVSRSHTPSTTRAVSPSRMAMNCFSTEPGAEEAVTARERVERKKAMVSISKPVRPMLRRTRQ